MTGALLALALAAGPSLGAPALRAPAPAAVAGAAPLAQEEWETPPSDDDEEHVRHLRLAVWGGEAYDAGGSGASFGNLGGEAGWAFGQLDLGVAGYGFRGLSADRKWSPVGLVRLTQRFKMRAGAEAAFGIGLGAAEVSGWEGWFQVSLGIRVPFGPMFLGGELGFERGDLLRLAAGIGVAL